MTFLYPWLLVGLAAAAVPLLLHLVQQREPPTVVFPAVRYLQDATRQNERRLRLRHWLLLLLRTLLIASLVLAAAGPTLPRGSMATHGPTALVLILDNSPSSAVVADGTPRLDALRRAARTVLARSQPADALWLITADGVPRRGDASALGALVADLAPSARRLDLGEAVTAADRVLREDRRPGEIVMLSDLQETALSAASPRAPITIGRPDAAPPANAGVAAVDPGPQPWPPEGGRVSVRLEGDSGPSRPVTAQVGNRPPRQALAPFAGGQPITLAVNLPGWYALTVALEPDELRLDDHRVTAVRVAPVARARCEDAGRHVQAACEVLAANNRLASGDDVSIGGWGRVASVVLPPQDLARLGALNRELSRRGVRWRFGAQAPAAGAVDSGSILDPVAVQRRLRLEPVGGSEQTGVLATVSGAPWLVRSGTTLLLGSRLEPGWTELPLRTEFMPFIDRLVNRLARGQLISLDAAPGEPVILPDLATAVVRGGESRPVEGGAAFRAPDTGLYALVGGRDTLGMLAVNPDPRESRLRVASNSQVQSLWPGARVLNLSAAAAAAFGAAARSDLRGPLLLLALVCGLGEVILASLWGRRPVR